MVDHESAHALEQDPDASQLALLQLLNEQPALSQRELSRALGLSLGKTHYLLHALLDKGLVKVRNFRRNDNKLAYAYLLTPSGIAAKARLTRDFLKFKMRQFEALRREIDALRRETEGNGPATQRAAVSQSTAQSLQPPKRPGALPRVPIVEKDLQ